MDVHSSNLVSTATSPVRQVAAAQHSRLRKPGDCTFKIRAQPDRSGVQKPYVADEIILFRRVFVWKINIQIFFLVELEASHFEINPRNPLKCFANQQQI